MIGASLNSRPFSLLDRQDQLVLFQWHSTRPSLPYYRTYQEFLYAFDWTNIVAFFDHLRELAQKWPGHLDPQMIEPSWTLDECLTCLDRDPRLAFFYLFFGKEKRYQQLQVYEIGYYFESAHHASLTIPGFRRMYWNVQTNSDAPYNVNLISEVCAAHDHTAINPESPFEASITLTLFEKQGGPLQQLLQKMTELPKKKHE